MQFSPSTLISLFLIAATGLVEASPKPKVPKGFVTTNGPKFQLDGKDFYFAGSNAYYLPFMNNATDVERGLKAAKEAGLKVMRTWGFYDKNATFDPLGLPQYGGEGAGPSDVYFRMWTNGVPEINYGPTGLQAFDGVVKAAEKVGIKLVVPLTNNWADYGGMDVSTINLGGKYHDDFYHVPKIVDSYKDYIKVFVNRYKSSPAIMAWQLANEPRCGADGVRNLPRSTACNATMMTNWVKDISSFIKKVDPYHLVTTGGEGEFNFPDNEDWAYSAGDGGDFYEELKIDTIDYGTFHLYPDWWSKTSAWGTQWIKDHATAQNTVRKPAVLEEYGWLSDAARFSNFGTVSNESRTDVLGEWQAASISTKLAGDQFWQYGWSGWATGRNHDDGFTLYLDEADAKQLIYDHVKKVEKLNK